MSAEIVSLDGNPLVVERDQEIITLLEELLDDARNGRLEGIACAVVAKDGFIRCCWKGSTLGTMMVGTIERLKYDMLRAIEEQN